MVNFSLNFLDFSRDLDNSDFFHYNFWVAFDGPSTYYIISRGRMGVGGSAKYLKVARATAKDLLLKLSDFLQRFLINLFHILLNHGKLRSTCPDQITGWQILTIFMTNRFPLCVATPFKLPCSRIWITAIFVLSVGPLKH